MRTFPVREENVCVRYQNTSVTKQHRNSILENRIRLPKYMGFISRFHADIRAARITRRGAHVHGSEPSRGTSKEYRRFPLITLPEPSALRMPLSEALHKRHSFTVCASDAPPTKEAWGTLFGNALRERPNSVSRNYPSGGGLFPIETYVLGHALEEHGPAVFHYQPRRHALEMLWNLPADFSIRDIVKNPEVPLAPLLLVFSAIWERSSVKYGDFAYYLSMLEAGHMAQNISLVAEAMCMGTRSLGGFDDELTRNLLDLDEEHEQPVYAMFLCPANTPKRKERR